VSGRLAIPEPSPGLDVSTLCDRVERWVADVDDVATLNDTDAKMAAIAAYISSTRTTGLARVEAVRRRLEVRIGELTPARNRWSEPEPGSDSLDQQTRSKFRAMAEHRDVVDAVVARSTDARPATRTRVLDAIAKVKAEHDPRTPERVHAEQMARRVRRLHDVVTGWPEFRTLRDASHRAELLELCGPTLREYIAEIEGEIEWKT
jgi:hypothetical protein